ncbi:MAG TPA: hypothetical protein VN703_01485, partial [Candidatus Sulfopaludibacter sp.]|nr:hypothetical protein [Candidatus Sulfopaludibacter sp.]
MFPFDKNTDKMNLTELIDFEEYLPMIGINGLYSKRKPLLYKGERVKSSDLVDILSLLDQQTTRKYCSYISSKIIKVDEDKEEIMSSLPKTEIKMVEIYDEFS